MDRRLGRNVIVVAVALAAALVWCAGCGGSGGTSPSSPVPSGATSGASAAAQSVKGASPGGTFTVAIFPSSPISGCAISGTRVVWMQKGADGATDLKLRDLATGDERTLASGTISLPAIGGDLVVWVTYNADKTSDISGRDLATGEDLTICKAPGNQNYPRVSNDVVVWEDWRKGNKAGADIYGWKLSDRKEFVVCDDSGYQWQPEIDGDLVVWTDHPVQVDSSSNPRFWGVYGKRLDTGQRVTVKVGPTMDAEWPTVDGQTVYWQEMASSPSLLGHDLATGKDIVVVSEWRSALDPRGVYPPLAAGAGLVASTSSDMSALKSFGPLQIKDMASGKTWPAGSACNDPSVSGDLVVWDETDPASPNSGNAVAVKGMWISR